MWVLLVSFITIQNINNVYSIGLIINSTCVSFESVSHHADTSEQSQQIGWIKVISCKESLDSTTRNPFTIYRTDYLSLSSRAISIKIQPFGGTSNPSYDALTVIAKPYSNPIQYGLNYGHELSYTYHPNGSVSGYASTSNWIGSSTALATLVNSVIHTDAPNDFHERIYHASHNGNGIHIFPNRDGTTTNARYMCVWKFSPFSSDIEIYFGFVPECGTESPSPSPYPTTYPTAIDFNIFKEVVISVCIVCILVIMVMVWFLIKFRKQRANRLRKDKDTIFVSRGVQTGDFEIASEVKNTAATYSNSGAANKDDQHQEGVGTIGCIRKQVEDSSDDSELYGWTGTGIKTTTLDERKKEISVIDDRVAKGTTKTGGSGFTVEGDDKDIAESYGDV